jgi:hypothetical protein
LAHGRGVCYPMALHLRLYRHGDIHKFVRVKNLLGTWLTRFGGLAYIAPHGAPLLGAMARLRSSSLIKVTSLRCV